MRNALTAIRRFLADQGAATIVEYAAMLALIVLVSVGVIGALGLKISNVVNYVQSHMPSN